MRFKSLFCWIYGKIKSVLEVLGCLELVSDVWKSISRPDDRFSASTSSQKLQYNGKWNKKLQFDGKWNTNFESETMKSETHENNIENGTRSGNLKLKTKREIEIKLKVERNSEIEALKSETIEYKTLNRKTQKFERFDQSVRDKWEQKLALKPPSKIPSFNFSPRSFSIPWKIKKETFKSHHIIFTSNPSHFMLKISQKKEIRNVMSSN